MPGLHPFERMIHNQQALTGMGAGMLQQVKWLAEAERTNNKEVLEIEKINIYFIYLIFLKM